jgi:hypothetical protein
MLTLQQSHAYRGALLALIISGSGVLGQQVSAAHTINPFVDFFGSWRGTGHVVTSDGHSERIACRANYSESGGGKALSQSLVCASDSYRFDVHSYVIENDRGVEGYWQEATRNVTGQLTGEVAAGRFEGSIAGPSFTAHLSLRADGRKQAVSITPQGGDIVRVDIILSRES